MKKLLTILGLVTVFALGVGGTATKLASAEAGQSLPLSETAVEEKWDAVETFDELTSVEEKFDFHFVSTQNARRGDEFEYSWTLQDGAVWRTGNVDPASDTVNIAIMTYVGEVYDDFELSVDFKAGSLTSYWPVIGIRQQIPGKYYTTEGGGAGVFMQQDGKITLWGPIVSGNTLGNLYEANIPDKATYYSMMWHNMRIRAEGSSVQVFVDDIEVASVTVNSTDYARGYVSLTSVNNDCAFDNFKIRGLGNSADKGNEPNRYEHADLGQSLDDVIENGYTGVKLPQDDVSTEVSAPTVSPSNQVVSTEDGVTELSFTVDYNNGTFLSLQNNGLAVDEEDYERSAATLTLKKEYVEQLPVGENVFTLTTSGGSAEFTVTVQRETVVFTDSVRVKKFSLTDVSFKMDFGVGTLSKVTLGGAILPEDAYTYTEDKLRIKNTFLSKLENGVYEVRVYDGKGTCVDCAITVGIEPSEAFILNYDGFTVTTNGYGQDLTVSEREGLNGNGGGITCNGSGTMLIFDSENVAYNFVHGTTYSVTTYFKFNSTVAGTSSVLDLLMPIYFKTGAGNADIGYIRYNDSDGYYFYPEGKCLGYEWTKEGDWYRLVFLFTYDSSWTRLEMPVWMVTDFTMDNFVLAPVAHLSARELPKKIAVPKNTTEDYTTECTKGVIGINHNGAALTEADYTYANGTLTLKKEFLSALPAGGNTITVCCTNSIHDITVEVNRYALNVTGNFAYTLGDVEMTLQVETDGFALNEASISDSRGNTLTIGKDYVVEGNQLVLKAAYLETVVAAEELTITFSADAVLKFTVTSNKLLDVDFDENGIDRGFAYNMTQTVTQGKDGNGMRLTNTTSATMLSLGGEFYDVEFEAQATYTFSFDLKIEDINTAKNFVISGNSCWMPITFGSGKDVTYLRIVKNGDTYTILNETQQVGISASVSEADANGFVHIEFKFVPTEACSNLTFDVWMPSTIVIDNLSLVKE